MPEQTEKTWTPEPWTIGRTDMQSFDGLTGEPIHYIYRGDDETAESRIRVNQYGDDGDPTADAARIVACVNACHGLPSDWLEQGTLADLLSAARRLNRESRMYQGDLAPVLNELESLLPPEVDERGLYDSIAGASCRKASLSRDWLTDGGLDTFLDAARTVVRGPEDLREAAIEYLEQALPPPVQETGE